MADTRGRISPLEFLRQVRQEIKKVSWPTRKETSMTAVAVLIFSLILAIYLLFVDGIIEFIVSKILS